VCRGPQVAFAKNIVEFPFDEKAAARRFAIAKKKLLRAVRDDPNIPPRNRASIQNYVSTVLDDYANRLIFYRTGCLIFWVGTTTITETSNAAGTPS
jgi:hypothetical protein